MPNELAKPVHPTRMPVILHPEHYDQWLSGGPDEALDLLQPFDSSGMRIALEGGEADDDGVFLTMKSTWKPFRHLFTE